MPNPYTGTDNDPISAAQHQYLGKDWEKFFKLIGGGKVYASAQGPGAPVSLGGAGRTDRGVGSRALPSEGERIGDEDVFRTNQVNAYLGQLTDENVLRQQSLKDMAAHNRAVDAAERDRQTAERGMAIANDPRTSAFGAPINPGSVRGQDGLVTGVPVGQPPVNRQAIAAQMAPGLIQPPAPPAPVTYGKPESMMVNGPDGKPVRSFVRMGSDGVPYDMARRPIDPAGIVPEDKSASAANPDVADAVTAMKEGTVPPQLPGRASKEYIAMLAESKRQGYDLARAATDWTATQKHVQTMNGAQQLRLNQAVNALPEMLDSVDSLAQQWKGGKFPLLNKASLALAKNGAYGPDAASIANQLDAQIADVTADLGNVYMGGNSPTDHALQLAGKSLKGEWDEKVLRDMVKLAKQNVQIRKNSIANTGVAGASPDNPYGNQPPAGAATAAAGGALPPLGAGEVYATDPQGNVHKGKAGTPLPAGWKAGGG